jgi:hypothetical protein
LGRALICCRSELRFASPFSANCLLSTQVQTDDNSSIQLAFEPCRELEKNTKSNILSVPLRRDDQCSTLRISYQFPKPVAKFLAASHIFAQYLYDFQPEGCPGGVSAYMLKHITFKTTAQHTITCNSFQDLSPSE